jgi:hypothetical protein
MQSLTIGDNRGNMKQSFKKEWLKLWYSIVNIPYTTAANPMLTIITSILIWLVVLFFYLSMIFTIVWAGQNHYAGSVSIIIGVLINLFLLSILSSGQTKDWKIGTEILDESDSSQVKPIRHKNTKVDSRIHQIITHNLGRLFLIAVFLELASFFPLVMLASSVAYGTPINKPVLALLNSPDKTEYLIYFVILGTAYGTLLMMLFMIFFGALFLRLFAKSKGVKRTWEYVIATEFDPEKSLTNRITIKLAGLDQTDRTNI